MLVHRTTFQRNISLKRIRSRGKWEMGKPNMHAVASLKGLSESAMKLNYIKVPFSYWPKQGEVLPWN